MGCFTHRRKQAQVFTDHKWDYINLDDFKAKGCGPSFVYGYLWFSLFLSVAVYAIDSFTAVNLLAFNKWSSKIEPTIPFDVSKWIFSICIIASFVNLAYEGVRAVRVMRRRNVAECYMDSLAARWESVRVGKGQGWRRFLVFAELTKSKKGAEYIALFTYFSLQSWIRVILCSGPRQVVNALTLRSVYVAKLAPTADSVEGSIVGFFDKIKALADEDYQQAVILSGMCFTLVVWIFSAIYLLAAVLFYICFLFHWIPRADGGLTGYCERKVNTRLTRIVTKKVNKALAKGQAKRERAEALAAKNGEESFLDRAATLPTIPDVDGLPSINSSELTNMDRARPPQFRTGTAGSAQNYSSRAPLVGSAAEMGYGRASPELHMHMPDRDFDAMASPRPGTSGSQRSLARPGYGPARLNGGSISSLRRAVVASPAPMEAGAMSPYRGPTSAPGAHFMNAFGDGTSRPAPSARAYEYDGFGRDGRSSPAPSLAGMYRTTGTPTSRPPQVAMGGAPQPMRSMTGPAPAPHAPQYPPHRNMTAPLPPTAGPAGGYEYYELAATAQSMRGPGQYGTGQGGGAHDYGYDAERRGGYRF